jgi:YD repeat-containing protein
MQTKFRSLILASAAIAAAAMTSIPATAVSATTLNVPFNFTVEGKTLPAGQYSIQRDDLGRFVRLQSQDAAQHLLWIAQPSDADTNRVVLRFEEHGQEHVLQYVQYGRLISPRLTAKAKKGENMAPEFQVSR